MPFAFESIKRSPNTLDAHRLIRWAFSAGVQGKVVDRLFKAYFVEGRDIGDRSVLVKIASECGLEAKLVEKLLAEGADVDLVREEIAEAQAIGVSGVPFFIFAGRLGVSGAQDVSVLRRAMAQAREMRGARSAGRVAAGAPTSRGGVERGDEIDRQLYARRQVFAGIASVALNSRRGADKRGRSTSAVNISALPASSLAGEKSRVKGGCLSLASRGEAGGFQLRGLGGEAPQKRKNFSERGIVAPFAFVDDPLHEPEFEPFARLASVSLDRGKRRGKGRQNMALQARPQGERREAFPARVERKGRHPRQRQAG